MSARSKKLSRFIHSDSLPAFVTLRKPRLSVSDNPFASCSAKRTNQPPHFPLINSCLRIPRHHRTQPRMKLPRTSNTRHLRNILRRDPTPRHYNDSPAGSPHQLCDPRHNVRRLVRPARSQQPRRPRRHNILQPRKQIHSLIKRPMKRHRQRRSLPHQFRSPLNVNTPITAQQPQHNSVHPCHACPIDRNAHLLKLRRRVNKVPAPWPHHRENRHSHTRTHRSHQLRARRHSSHVERTTQLNSRRPSAFSRNRSLQTLHRNFHQDSSTHQSPNVRPNSLFPNFRFPFSNAIFFALHQHP